MKPAPPVTRIRPSRELIGISPQKPAESAKTNRGVAARGRGPSNENREEIVSGESLGPLRFGPSRGSGRVVDAPRCSAVLRQFLRTRSGREHSLTDEAAEVPRL